MLKIETEERGDVVVVRPVGSIDTGTAFDFENRIVEMLDSGSRLFVVDFSQVEQLTSSGIRVLLMLAKKLDGLDGTLKLCSLTHHVRTVLEISGLAAQFDVEDTVEEAAGSFDSKPAARSKVTSLVTRLVVGPDGSSGAGGPAGPGAAGGPSGSSGGGEPSSLTRLVAGLVADR